MGIRFAAAKAIGAVTTWGLQDLLKRNGKNTPGKLALYADPQLIAHLRPKIKHSMCVVGTNGKTTVNNLIADVLEAAGHTVICNRDGANLDSGVSTALLQAKPAEWGVFESDELWLIKTLPFLQSEYVLLLNLFRDQLDRCGEIDHIQDMIVAALEQSPNTTLVYNGDDPQCALIARRVKNPSLAFGIEEDLHLPQNTVSDAQMCQLCEGIMDYGWRQYGQLGTYSCPKCGFARPNIDFATTDVKMDEEGATFNFIHAGEALTDEVCANETWHVQTSVGAAYMVYNLSAVAAMAQLAGCSCEALQKCVSAFAPNNGRLQKLTVRGHATLLNLAKNPTGFNQNLKLVTQGDGPRAVAFFINDKEADGHDISWLWDIDFEELAAKHNLAVYAGGMRANDMQVRLRYAGIRAEIVEGAEDLFDKIAARNMPSDTSVFLIANYTSLPKVKADLERLAQEAVQPAQTQAESESRKIQQQFIASIPIPEALDRPPVVIAHMYPDLLNLYGDGGNVTVLQRRLQWRGIPVEVRIVPHGEDVNLDQVDLVFLGGGPDREQRMASVNLMNKKDELRAYVESGGPLLAICGGYQILGTTWLLGEEEVPGLGILDMRTGRVEGGSTNRLIDNIALRTNLASHPVVGFENHAGRTFLEPNTQAFGEVASNVGHGNNDTSKQDGARYKNVIGTYLHGPLLGKNPEIADYLLQAAINRNAKRHAIDAIRLEPLDDAVELAANEVMAKRLHAMI